MLLWCVCEMCADCRSGWLPSDRDCLSTHFFCCRWSQKALVSCRRQARPCSWRKSGSRTPPVKAATLPPRWHCTRTHCRLILPITSFIQIDRRPSSRWGGSNRRCKTRPEPETLIANGQRYVVPKGHLRAYSVIMPSFSFGTKRIAVQFQRYNLK